LPSLGFEEMFGFASREPDPEPSVTAPTAQELAVQCRVLLGNGAPAADGSRPVLVSVQPFRGESRTPVDVCCVVDTSGSMGNEALVKAEDGNTTGHGLTVLDVVRHALKTIIRVLGDGDRLALVSFANEASKIFDLTPMTAAGRTTTENHLEDLRPQGMTNLWDGLKMGLEVLKAKKDAGSNSTRNVVH